VDGGGGGGGGGGGSRDGGGGGEHLTIVEYCPKEAPACGGTQILIIGPWVQGAEFRFHHGFCRVRVSPIGVWLVRCSGFTMDSAVLGLAPLGCG
jgi:hypothetical protein